jgi:hypothetical protein
MNNYKLSLVEKIVMPNALGQNRTLLIKRNGFGRLTWFLQYQDNPAIADREYSYTDNYFDTVAAVKRSIRNFMKKLAQ